jgi:hypothetical protein
MFPGADLTDATHFQFFRRNISPGHLAFAQAWYRDQFTKFKNPYYHPNNFMIKLVGTYTAPSFFR